MGQLLYSRLLVWIRSLKIFIRLCIESFRLVLFGDLDEYFSSTNASPIMHIKRKTLICCLAAMGFVFAVGHFGIAQQRTLLAYPNTDLVHIALLPFFSVWIWIAGSVLFYSVGVLFGSRRNLAITKLEYISLALWSVWVTMPVFDVPHMFGVPFLHMFGVGAHISWIWAFTLMPILTFRLLRHIAKTTSRYMGFPLLLSALAIPFIGRFVIENLPVYIDQISRWFGFRITYNEAAFFVAAALFGAVYVIYMIVASPVRNLKTLVVSTTKKGIIFSLVAAVLVLNIGFTLEGTILPSWLGRKNSIDKQEMTSGDFGQGDSQYTHSHTWTSPDYEAATFTRNQDNNFEGVLKEYAGVVDLDFNPAQATINAVRCKVNFTAATADFNTGDTTPRAHCDIQPNGGSYQLGAYIGPLSGASLQTWTWSSPAWGSSLTQLDNNVRVWGQTAWDGNTNTAANDVIAFDSVTIEIDYEANLTQTDYRWYNNNDNVQPGSARAAANTATTAVEANEVIRLRTAIQVDTGRMDASTEAFKLQYASKSGGSCGDDESWSDVGIIGSGAAWRGYNNANPVNGTQISSALFGSYGQQSYQEDNTAFNNHVELNASATNRGEWDWVVQANTASPNTTYCFRNIESGGMVLDNYSVYPEATTSSALTINQAAYRWFENDDTLSAGSSLASQDTTAYASFEDAPFRLRVLLDAGGQSLPSGANFKLQYATRSGICDTSFSGESYADVQSGSGDIRWYDASPADGGTPTVNADDPTYIGHSKVYQRYAENNPSTSASTTPVNQSALWDFSLADVDATPGNVYCFRVVKSDGTPLDSYTQVPELTTVGVFNTDIVDGSGVSVTNPIVAMSLGVTQFSCQTTTGLLGVASQKVRAQNGQPNSGWTLSVAATNGSTALWSSGGLLYDFNDSSGSPVGCGAGLDSDVYAGQLSIDPSAATITPEPGCGSSGITKGGATAFDEGLVDSIVLATGSAGVELFCYFDFEGINFSQTIPGAQPSGTYLLDLTITLTAI